MVQDIMSHFLSNKVGLLLLMISGKQSEFDLQAVIPCSSQMLRTVKNAGGVI